MYDYVASPCLPAPLFIQYLQVNTRRGRRGHPAPRIKFTKSRYNSSRHVGEGTRPSKVHALHLPHCQRPPPTTPIELCTRSLPLHLVITHASCPCTHSPTPTTPPVYIPDNLSPSFATNILVMVLQSFLIAHVLDDLTGHLQKRR